MPEASAWTDNTAGGIPWYPTTTPNIPILPTFPTYETSVGIDDLKAVVRALEHVVYCARRKKQLCRKCVDAVAVLTRIKMRFVLGEFDETTS